MAGIDEQIPGLFYDKGGAVFNVMHPDFGATGDGVTDDTAAIRAAIAAATDNATIVFPSGTYLVGDRIIEGTTLTSGLKFIASGAGGGSALAIRGVVIKYTGTNICWDIQEPLGTDAAGNWTWEGFTFRATQPAGGMFQFNDVSLAMTNDATSPNIIRRVSFINCSFWGEGSSSVTGNGIQALGVFALSLDTQCQVRSWKRGVYLKGCENPLIMGRFQDNARHLMVTTSNTFGNHLMVDAAEFLTVLEISAESSVCAWIDAPGTMVTPFFEPGTPVGTRTALYLNGEQGTIINPLFNVNSSGLVAFDLGADAREWTMINPRYTAGAGPTTTIAEPSSWRWETTIDEPYNLTIINPSTRFIEHILPVHPRVKVLNAQRSRDIIPIPENLVVGTNGVRQSTDFISAFHAEKINSEGFGALEKIEADSSAFFGYRITLEADALNDSAALVQFEVGQHVSNGDVARVRVNYKNASTPGSGGLRHIAKKNGANITNGAVPDSNTYVNFEFSYELSGFSVGDTFEIGVYNTADVQAHISGVWVDIIDGIESFTDGDTTPSVAAGKVFTTANTSGTSITDFDNAGEQREITILIADANTTFVHGAGVLLLSGAVNYTPASGAVLRLIHNGTVWLEVSRSDNT